MRGNIPVVQQLSDAFFKLNSEKNSENGAYAIAFKMIVLACLLRSDKSPRSIPRRNSLDI